MPSFGPASRKHLATCHPDIQRVMHRAIEEIDFSVICGVRSKEDQEQAVADGNSEVHWPDGMHNVDPDNPRYAEHPDKSGAVDIVPYPVDWNNLGRFKKLAVVIKRCAQKEGVDLDWGHDLWNWDAPHYQLRSAS